MDKEKYLAEVEAAAKRLNQTPIRYINKNKLQRNGKPARNEKCPCGSGLKYKFCHGDIVKQEMARDAANRAMAILVNEEMKRKGLLPYRYTCNSCNANFGVPKESKIIKGTLICPECNSTDLRETNNEQN